MSRSGAFTRSTAETTIEASLELDGRGQSEVHTGIGFLDHLLVLLSRHSAIDIVLSASGDVHVDAHHTAEDCGIVLGRGLDGALGDRAGIRRFGHARIPMDEALADCAIDVSGRFHADIEPRPGAFDGTDPWLELVPHLLESLAREAHLTVHLEVRKARSVHHQCEAMIKAFARALRIAIELDPRLAAEADGEPAVVPSSKGTLT